MFSQGGNPTVKKFVVILFVSLVLMMTIIPGVQADDRPYEHVHMTIVFFRAVVFPDAEHPVDPVNPIDPGEEEADLGINVLGPDGVWTYATDTYPIYMNDNDIHMFYNISWVIPTDDFPEGSVPITFALHDHECPGDDDLMWLDYIDINPTDIACGLDINVNLETGEWTGDTSTGYSMGDGDTEFYYYDHRGGQKGAIFFGITLSPSADTDGDGIPDYIELHGIDYLDEENAFQTDTNIVCDPCRETIAVQADYTAETDPGNAHTHRPVDAAIDEAVEMFNNAPRSAVTGNDCPYSGYPLHDTGVDLIVDVADNPLEMADISLDCFNFDFGALQQSMPFYRTPYYHHGVYGHAIAGASSSGRSCDNKKFFIALGNVCDEEFCDPDDEDGLCDQICDLGVTQNGGTRLQALTLVHELGHNLGLQHGGGDTISRFKPNYLSVMSYMWRNYGLIDEDNTTWIDYSRHEMGPLDMRNLDEAAGVPGVLPDEANWMTFWTDINANILSGPIGHPLDWNGNGVIDEDPVGVDIDGTPENCICGGENGVLESETGGDDIIEDECIMCGPNRYCESSAEADDDPYYLLNGYDDWSRIQFRAAMAPQADAAPVAIHDESSAEEIAAEWLLVHQAIQAYFTPDVLVTKTVDAPDALPGDILTYTVTVENIGTGLATSIEMTDTMPNGTVITQNLPDLSPGTSTVETYSFTVPSTVTDGEVLINTATVTATNVRGDPERDTSNNDAQASTIVHTPVLAFTKTATTSVNAGEAITYSLTYENTGSANAEEVTITDILPGDSYYAAALDAGSGPHPNAVMSNPDGTTTLTWIIGPVAASSGSSSITYTSRPGLLFLGGETVTNDATLDFSDAKGNEYQKLSATASTSITTVVPGQSPAGLGYYRNHQDVWTPAILAMIQATDIRYDANTDGILSADEVRTTLKPGGNQPKILQMQLLATDFNMATRQVNAATSITSTLASRLGISNVHDAVEYAQDTLALPVNKGTRDHYSDATTLLDEINNGISERY